MVATANDFVHVQGQGAGVGPYVDLDDRTVAYRVGALVAGALVLIFILRGIGVKASASVAVG